ncbi:hypothetical protein OUZ56_030280 [Daphnia magna]|uniref:Uncharacterized protein n=1 Tax=Daphnia magna TaxID=35525 RepID=A0ABQ9ZQU7_9CRUS|nr:hypothetical protein OUZ56_030280 [Daphnia magna]
MEVYESLLSVVVLCGESFLCQLERAKAICYCNPSKLCFHLAVSDTNGLREYIDQPLFSKVESSTGANCELSNYSQGLDEKDKRQCGVKDKVKS